MNKEQVATMVDIIQEWDLYPSEMNDIYKLLKDNNLDWDDIDLGSAVCDVDDETFAKIKEIAYMGWTVDDNKWKIHRLTKNWNTDRYITKAKKVQRIWDNVIIELLENYIEIDFDKLKEQAKYQYEREVNEDEFPTRKEFLGD